MRADIATRLMVTVPSINESRARIKVLRNLKSRQSISPVIHRTNPRKNIFIAESQLISPPAVKSRQSVKDVKLRAIIDPSNIDREINLKEDSNYLIPFLIAV